MAYTRRAAYRKRGRRAPKRQQATRRIARQEARKVIRKNVESKKYTGFLFQQPVDGAGLLGIWDVLSDPSTISTIVQGVGETSYLGSKISPTYLMIKGTIQFPIVTPDPYNNVRLIVYQGLTNFSSSAATFLQFTSPVTGPYAPYSTLHDNQIRVLKDKLIRIDSTSKLNANFKIKIGMRKLRQITFSDQFGTVEKGTLIFNAISDSGAVPHPIITGFWRLHFKDA